jgi:hypothetical protein
VGDADAAGTEIIPTAIRRPTAKIPAAHLNILDADLSPVIARPFLATAPLPTISASLTPTRAYVKIDTKTSCLAEGGRRPQVRRLPWTTLGRGDRASIDARYHESDGRRGSSGRALASDNDQERRGRLLLLGKGAVLAHLLARPFAAEWDEVQASGVCA